MKEKKGNQISKKAPHEVSKRNERERIRVSTVNQAFLALQRHLPSIRSHNKRVSKLRILKTAISYIQSLQDLLQVILKFFPNYERLLLITVFFILPVLA
ncbi:unnamed protein product [Enterobius vermicularis]|uniref:BHLH domain-containing protein n=1 Tax=Enterobius vermicularis TaxID=51028 RepID=A0A0N4UZM1_ENTVE|nr:unnamed protein product [Enterobius vermicularis]